MFLIGFSAIAGSVAFFNFILVIIILCKCKNKIWKKNEKKDQGKLKGKYHKEELNDESHDVEMVDRKNKGGPKYNSHL
jgi:hypothetical protein